MTHKTYSISDLSREFEITPRTIRFYEDQQLLFPQREGRKRIYTNRDRTRLKLILRGKRLGFPLSEVGEMFQLYDSNTGHAGQLHYFLERIRERRNMLLQQRQDIEIVLQELDSAEKHALKALSGNAEAST